MDLLQEALFFFFTYFRPKVIADINLITKKKKKNWKNDENPYRTLLFEEYFALKDCSQLKLAQQDEDSFFGLDSVQEGWQA